MKNKKVRDILIAIGILLLLLLFALGVYLMTQRKSTSNGDGDRTEASMIIQEKNTNASWEREEFKDETTDQKEATTAEQKGGSETLDIIPSQDDVEEEKTDGIEIQWQDGIW